MSHLFIIRAGEKLTSRNRALFLVQIKKNSIIHSHFLTRIGVDDVAAVAEHLGHSGAHELGGDGAGRRVWRRGERRDLRNLDLLLDVHGWRGGRRRVARVGRVAETGVVAAGHQGAAAAHRAGRHLSLPQHLQLASPVPLVHRPKLVSSTAHAVCSDGWNHKEKCDLVTGKSHTKYIYSLKAPWIMISKEQK